MHCENIEPTSETVRPQKYLVKQFSQKSISSIVCENGDYTTTREETAYELFRVHLRTHTSLNAWEQ